jgi:hypothetical protein
MRPLARLGPSVIDVLPAAVRQNLVGWRAVLNWSAIVSRDVASRSQAVSFRGGCLTVQVVSSVWMHHLMALKRQLISELNAATGTTGATSVTAASAAGASGGAPDDAVEGPIRDIHFVLNPRPAAPPVTNRPQGREG